nr:hypothetical protein [uncultured Carboxylicivirga sp.]
MIFNKEFFYKLRTDVSQIIPIGLLCSIISVKANPIANRVIVEATEQNDSMIEALGYSPKGLA